MIFAKSDFRKGDDMENIKQYIDGSLEIGIWREKIDDDLISAIPLKRSNDLLLILYLYDFMLDGYKVLSMKDITEIQREESDKFQDYIIQRQGIIKNVDRLEKVNIDSWNDVFRFLHEKDKMLDISLERIENKRNFFVGKVDEIYDNFMMFREVTTLGIFKERRKKIYYEDITMISFGNKYSEMLDKYADEYKKSVATV